MLLKRIAAAQAMAAPVIPILGIRIRLMPIFRTSATITLKRFHMLRPPIRSTTSTGPMPVATSMAMASTASAVAPSA